MHAEGPADRRDAHQPAQELGQLLGEHPELVDDDHEPGQGRGEPCVHEGEVGVEVGDPGLGEPALATLELGRQRDERPLGEPVVEVGDEADGVGQPGAVGAVLKNGLRRSWTGSERPINISPRTQDAVYRAVGRGGIVLIGEGPRSRTQRLPALPERAAC